MFYNIEKQGKNNVHILTFHSHIRQALSKESEL